MRRRAVVLAFSLVASLVTIAVPSVPVDAAGPPACPFTNTTQRVCNRYTNVGARGSIGLIGDSVLLGSSDTWSNPGLPAMLAANGFGPINLIATLGMRTRWNSDGNLSGYYWVDRWKANGFSPSVIAINLGANMLGTCTQTNPAPCKAKIDELLDRIAYNFPLATVWWAKIVHKNYPSGTYTSAMLGWNLAMDQAAALRPNLQVWDWPTALATANPAIAMDVGGIHPTSGTQYVKRSTLMAEHITLNMGAGRYVGPRTPLPTGDGSGWAYAPVTEAPIYRTPLDGATFAATETRSIDLSAVESVDDAAKALAITVTATNPASNGFLTVWRCGDTRPATSNLNFSKDTMRTAQVITRITATGHLCLYSHVATDVTISIQGNFLEGSGTQLNPIAAVRPLDTRNTGRAQELIVNVPGTDVLAAAVTITTTGASSGGTITSYGCDAALPDVANLSYQPDETVASAAFVPVSADGTICVHVTAPDNNYPDVILDVTGVFKSGTGLRFVAAPATRLLDTRSLLGGWLGRHGATQTIDVVAAPVGALAVTGTITTVRPMFKGFLNAYPCGQAAPPTSSVNSNAGLVMANSITVGVEPTQRTMCIYSHRNTNTLFDVVGWWVEGNA